MKTLRDRRPQSVALEPPTSFNEAIAGEIRAAMARRNIRQADLAAVLGRSQQWLSRRLIGVVSCSFDDLEAISDALNVSIWEILEAVQPRVAA